MLFNIVSDLHTEKNGVITLNNENHVLLCGDVSSNYKKSRLWEMNNTYNVTFVYGNHDYYKGNITFDDVMRYKPMTDDIIVIYGTLWMDFNLLGTQKDCMKLANDMNADYKNISFCGERFTAEHACKVFEKSVSVICDVCEKHPNKKIVVATHFAPSYKSVPSTYKKEYAPMFASDLEWLIKKYKNIKLWAHGHVHTSYDYMIEQCRVVCNPLGFQTDKFPDCYNNKFDSNFIVEV